MHTSTSSAVCHGDSHALIQAGPIEEERSYVKSALPHVATSMPFNFTFTEQ